MENNINRPQVTIAVCNYNTTWLTINCIKSIIANVKSVTYKIVILDNSDKEKFVLPYELRSWPIQIIDNTTQKYLDFNKFVSTFFTTESHNNHASAKHCYSIQFLLSQCTTKYLLLFDSDIILLKDIDFIDEQYITIADNETRKLDFRKTQYATRYLPYIQLFNIELLKKYNINYFDGKRIGENRYNNKIYDTGASFYEDIQRLNKQNVVKSINYSDYIIHFAGKSWDTSESNIQCIVAFTTFGQRLSTFERICQQLVRQKTSVKFKICVTLDISDIQRLTPVQKKYIATHHIEVLIGDNKLRPHNKYFFVMQKYRHLPIITLDDDIRYDIKTIELLYNSYKHFPQCVSALRTHTITFTDGVIAPYKNWQYESGNVYMPSHLLFATGVGGVLYPPDILKISDDDMPLIEQSIIADDVFLKKKELMLDVQVVRAQPQKNLRPYSSSNDDTSLSYKGQNMYMNDPIISALNLDKHFSNKAS